MRTALLCLILSLSLSLSLAGGEVRVSCDAADGRAAGVELGALLTLDPALGDLHTDLLVAGWGERPVTLALVDASDAGTRQAMAHALGVWWVVDAQGQRLFIAQDRLLPGRPVTRAHVSTLVDAACEPLVERLMAPWLVGDAGVSHEPSDATWTAALDQDGHGTLDLVLHALEGRDSPLPALVPDAEAPDPDRPLAALKATTWGSLVRGLAASGISCSVAPALVLEGLPGHRLELAAGRLGDLPRQLALVGIQAGFIHGVLCLAGPAGPAGLAGTVEDRQHPAQRRRLGILPLHHLIRDAEEGMVLASLLRQRVAPWWWTRPGAGLWFLESRRTLLVAADLPTIHAVLGSLVMVDRIGLDAGLRRLRNGEP